MGAGAQCRRSEAYLLVVADAVGAGEDGAVARDGGADVVAQRQRARRAQRQRLVVGVQRRVHRHHARVQLLTRLWKSTALYLRPPPLRPDWPVDVVGAQF